MKINLEIKIHTEDNSIVLNYSKSYESNVIPSMGVMIKDSLFAHYKKITEVVVDYANKQCYVTLEPKLDTKDRLNGHIQEVAKLHQWSLVKE